MKIIDSFSGKYSFLSNFFLCSIMYRGQIWPSSEHLFQGFKAINVEDRERIRLAYTPSEAKRYGKTIEIRSDWEHIKERVMLQVVKMKFNQNQHLIDMLIETAPAYLIEGNRWHDNEWGNCFCESCKNKEGKNKLGIILMAIRRRYVNDFEWVDTLWEK